VERRKIFLDEHVIEIDQKTASRLQDQTVPFSTLVSITERYKGFARHITFREFHPDLFSTPLPFHVNLKIPAISNTQVDNGKAARGMPRCCDSLAPQAKGDNVPCSRFFFE